MTIMMRLLNAAFPRQKHRGAVKLRLPMSYLVSLKAVRLLLAVSVSIWLAGGCLFGCSNTAMAASATTQPAVEGESCHAARAHDCCAKSKQPKQPTGKVKVKLNEMLAGVSSLPREGMNECPLMIGATAVVTKNSSNSPDLVGATTAPLRPAISDSELPQRQIVDPFLPNRGPTYLRCCVFLI